MQAITRTPIATGGPVTPEDLADHLRIEAIEVAGAMRYARAAADEIEQYTNLALLDQTITAVADPLTAKVHSLPIGPVQAGATVTVDLQEHDGSYTPFTDGSYLVAGLHAAVHFDSIPGGHLRITYTAGYGTDAAAIPDDLSLAICDQALRLYDRRGDVDNTPGLAPSTARICARYRRVAV